MSNIEEETYTVTKDWSLESIEDYLKDLEEHKKLIQSRINGVQKARGEAIDRLVEDQDE